MPYPHGLFRSLLLPAVRFGAVGAEHVMNDEKDEEGNIVQHQDDVFIIIAPQVRIDVEKRTFQCLIRFFVVVFALNQHMLLF